MVGIPREEKRGGITTVVWEKDSVPRKLVLKSVPERERERERERGGFVDNGENKIRRTVRKNIAMGESGKVIEATAQ